MSTVKIIKYQDSGAFEFNADEIEVGIIGARLKKRVLSPDELILATGRATQDADLGASLPVFATGEAVWDETNKYDSTDTTNGSYFSLNDDSARDGLTPLAPTSHFNFGEIGTIRFKYTPNYDGAPLSNRYVFSTGDTNQGAGLGSLISMQHLAGSGVLNIRTYNATGSQSTIINTAGVMMNLGQAYEIEIVYNGSTGAQVDGMPDLVAVVYVDGVLVGSGAVRSGAGNRDYFYLGNYYAVAGFSSEASFSDLQIFNTAKHIANFVDEIPRIAGIYPLESKLVPIETSVAEGLVSLDEAVIAPDDTSVQYLTRVESANYWINGLGNLVVSDGTFLESNTLVEIILPANVAAITAFISAGARLTMVPVLNSGSTGMTTPLLFSNTLEYLFYAVPITCIGCTLYGWVKDNCDGIVDGTVRVYTKKPILSQGNLVSFDTTVPIEAPNGFFEMDLIRPNLISVATSITPSVPSGTQDTYKLEANWVDIDGLAWSIKKNILIPDASSILLTTAITDAEVI